MWYEKSNNLNPRGPSRGDRGDPAPEGHLPQPGGSGGDCLNARRAGEGPRCTAVRRRLSEAPGNNRSASIRESHRGDDVEGAVDVKRGEVWWVAFPEPLGRRPAVLVSRDEADRGRGAGTPGPLPPTNH